MAAKMAETNVISVIGYSILLERSLEQGHLLFFGVDIPVPHWPSLGPGTATILAAALCRPSVAGAAVSVGVGFQRLRNLHRMFRRLRQRAARQCS